MKVWLDGRLQEASAARIDPADRGLLLGDGLFETIAVRDDRPRHPASHLARLGAGARLLRIPCPDDRAIGDALEAVLDANRIGTGSARITLTRGPGPRGLASPPDPHPTLLVTSAVSAAPSPAARAVVSRIAGRAAGSPLAAIKSLSYLEAILALDEAVARGGDEALLRGRDGRLACATAANLFVVRGGALLTPPVGDGALPGLRRARLVAACGARERGLGADDLRAAEAVFLANSLGLRPVASLDGDPLSRDDAMVADLAARTA